MSCFPHRCYSSCFLFSNFEGFQIDPGIIFARVWFLFRFVKHGKSPWFETQENMVLFFSSWRFFRSDSTRILFPTHPNNVFWCGTYLAFSMESMLSGPVLHRHPTSPLLVTHVDSIEWTVIIYTYYIDKTLQTHFKHIFFWKWIPFEPKRDV